MSCEELRGEYELFILGISEEPEKSALREHLERGCQECLGGVKEAREWLAAMALACPAPEPPRRLRSRVLAAAGHGARPWRRYLPAGVAVAACILAAIAVLNTGAEHRRQSAALESQLNSARVQLAAVRGALAFLTAPGTRQVTFGQGRPAPPSGNVFVNPRNGVLLLVSNLPPAPAGKTYEMWIVPQSGNPVAAGLFDAGPEGTAVHLLRRTLEAGAAAAVAVTLEEAGGASQPTSTPLIVVKL